MSVTKILSVCTLLLATAAHAAPDWPEFRGLSGNGLVTVPGDPNPVGLPVTWSETEHVAWKTAIPHRGWSTPVVAGNDIWLTTATEDGTDYYALCIDADTGKIRRNKKLFHTDKPEPLGNSVNCYASPSPAIEDGRVYVHFGSYGTACLDATTGEVIWSRDDFPCRHYRGPGSSLVLFRDLLYLTFDGVDLQYVVALNKITGETVWRTDRTTEWHDLDENGKPKREGDFRKAYGTPLIFEADGKLQMISVGSSTAFAYDPLTGKERWKVVIPGYTPSARPLFGHSLVYFPSGRGEPQLLAYRADGAGDVTESHRVWKFEGDEVPLESSPILVGDYIYMVSGRGTATCLDAKTGEVVWQERIGGNYVASPIHADGLLYFCSTQGKTTVLKAERAFEVVAVNELDEGFMASPAVAGDALILRTKTHLYRIGE